MKTKTIVVIGGIAVAVGALYLMYKNKQQQVQPVIPGPTQVNQPTPSQQVQQTTQTTDTIKATIPGITDVPVNVPRTMTPTFIKSSFITDLSATKTLLRNQDYFRNLSQNQLAV